MKKKYYVKTGIRKLWLEYITCSNQLLPARFTKIDLKTSYCKKRGHLWFSRNIAQAWNVGCYNMNEMESNKMFTCLSTDLQSQEEDEQRNALKTFPLFFWYTKDSKGTL